MVRSTSAGRVTSGRKGTYIRLLREEEAGFWKDFDICPTLGAIGLQ